MRIRIEDRTSVTAALLIALAALLVNGALAPMASAAVPGTNGKIAFVSNRDVGAGEIYSIHPDGSAVRRLTFPSGGASAPAYSPDGTQIAFKSPDNDIHVMDAEGLASDGSGAIDLTDSAVVETEPAWSPDGSRIAFVASSIDVDGETDLEIWVMNADGSGRTQLTDNSFSDGQPAFSPNGEQIAFVSARTGDSNRNVYVMNADGSGQTDLTQNTTEPLYQGHDDAPTWTPDGSRIVYTNATDVDIWSMAPDGSGKVNLTATPPSQSESDPTVAPDGSKIAYVATNGDTNRDIEVMDADGSDQELLLASPANDIRPDWQQDSIAPETSFLSPPAKRSNDPTPALAFEADESGATFECSLDGGEFAACDSAVTPSPLADGEHSFAVRATDVAGNAETQPAVHVWTVDTVSPTIGRLAPTPGSVTGDRTPRIGATLGDDGPPPTKGDVTLRVKGKVVPRKRWKLASETGRLTYTSKRLPRGRVAVRLDVSDTAGNAASRSWSFRIR